MHESSIFVHSRTFGSIYFHECNMCQISRTLNFAIFLKFAKINRENLSPACIGGGWVPPGNILLNNLKTTYRGPHFDPKMSSF